ncbi:tetratricopeptide repeat protein [Enterococcus sp. AZ126]|uniref:tetratricopeptide repeat protein n=1 Tax=Enterococcus sp. AZ126 TaxID=2774635 RepID=UPI003F220E2D
MFDFLKKKKTSVRKTDLEEQLTEQQKNDIRQKIDQMTVAINGPELPEALLAEKYEEMGLLLVQLNEIDQAIASLEKSQSFKNSIGSGYKKLMSLYNQKRAEAAKNGDNAGIDQWMNKMDDMRQIAKKVTISGQ